ncbi:MAG: ATP phosphoribosyltransferase regulatory subunit [Nitrospinota bacterium]
MELRGDAAPRTGIPKGVRLYLPPDAARKREVETRLLEVFQRWGFQEIVTPTLDYHETATRALGHQSLRDLFKIIDRETGELLTLRSDITPQIAHLAATSLRTRPLPLRLCYSGRVYRYVHTQGRVQREFHQSGVELMGLESLEADAEVIAIAVESLRACGLKEFAVILTHMGFLREILEGVQAPDAWTLAYREALGRKDLTSLGRLVGRLDLPAKLRSALLQVPEWVGGAEVLDRAQKALPGRKSRRAMEDLRSVLEMLEVYGVAGDVTFDLSEARGFNYYTGPVFEVFSPLAGYPLCSGGRYDDLVGRFGAPAPATGFAVDVGGLLETLKTQEGESSGPSGPDVILIDFFRRKDRALALARRLRRRGFRVARDIIRRDLAASLAYARETGIRFGVVLGHRKTPAGKAWALDLVRGDEAKVSPESLPDTLQRWEKRHADRGRHRRPMGG